MHPATHSQVLEVHPSLPGLLPLPVLLPLASLLTDPWLRARIPCLAVAAVAERPEVRLAWSTVVHCLVQVVEALPPPVLEAMLTSRRIISCIPQQALERLVDRFSIMNLVTRQ